MCKQKFILLVNLLVLFAVFEARASTIPTSAVGQCGPSEFQCSNGSCIKSRSRCDQKLDCLDGSDEVGCDQEVDNTLVFDDNSTTVNSTINNIQNLTNLNPSNCTQDEFPCQVGGCVLSSARCNSTSECPDGSDETNCTSQILPSTSTKKLRKRKIPKKTSNETNDAYEETLHLLEEGDRKIELRQDYRDLVLVAGLTGAGKTTITKFITNPNDLEAYDTGERFLIRDIVNNSISVNSTIVSKTIFPQLLIHGPSNTAFYDLPGFSDTRNATIEIANAFFMKKVAEHAERVKILLIVSHKGLRVGGSRTDIKTLIEHLIKFVKDIEKFAQGVVLVASKVEDRRPNDRVINFIGEFLKEVDAELPNVFRDSEKLGHAKDFLSALLEKDEKTGKYKRIGTFKQPEEVGPLMDDPDFESTQNQTQDLVLNGAQFVRTLPGDFGFSVSAESTLFAKTLASKTKTKVSFLIEELTEVIEEKLFKYPGNSSSSASSRWPVLKIWTRVHEILHQLTNALYEVVNCSSFLHVLNDTISVFSIPKADEVILDLVKLNKQIAFFETISQEVNVPPQKWVNSLHKLEKKVEKKTKELAEELNNHVMNITTAISSGLEQHARTLMTTATNATTTITATKSNTTESSPLNTKTLYGNLNEDFNSINRMLSQLLTTSTFAQFSYITLNDLEKTHLGLPSPVLTPLRDMDFDMEFNSGINGQRFPFKINIWIQPIQLFSSFLQTQILTLNMHFSEEERLKHEEEMKLELSMLQNETRLAAEKAKEEREQWAQEFNEREKATNGSLTTLAEILAKTRRDNEEERKKAQKKFDESRKAFEKNLTSLANANEELAKEIERNKKTFREDVASLKKRMRMVIQSPRITNWGDWGSWEYCPNFAHAIGFQLMAVSPHCCDETALNAIRLICSDSSSTEISSKEGSWGQWRSKHYCSRNGKLSGFDFRVEASIGSGDDTAANNINFDCRNEQGDHTDYLGGDGENWGEWRGKVSCPPDTFICGIRTQVEPLQTYFGKDDTALNNVDFMCCF